MMWTQPTCSAARAAPAGRPVGASWTSPGGSRPHRAAAASAASASPFAAIAAAAAEREVEAWDWRPALPQ